MVEETFSMIHLIPTVNNSGVWQLTVKYCHVEYIGRV